MFNRNRVFLIIVVLMWGMIGYKIMPRFVDPNVKITVYQQKKLIKSIDDSISRNNKKTFFVNDIDFEKGDVLVHPRLGDLGYKKNFYIIAESKFNVAIEGAYIFYAGSDDGFSLKIDGKEISYYKKDRSFSFTRATIKMKKGMHSLEMRYFQGYGPLGLKLQYKKIGSRDKIFAGKSSKYIKFIPFKKNK